MFVVTGVLKLRVRPETVASSVFALIEQLSVSDARRLSQGVGASEVATGALVMATGPARVVGLASALCFLLASIPLLRYLSARHPEASCGCTGDLSHIRAGSGAQIFRNVLLIGCAAAGLSDVTLGFWPA
jgi:uncharacterized membrane protein YkgB